MSMTSKIIWAVAYIVLAPLIGGLLEGFDRKISARMQRRIGPPILQPFYDVRKLFNKQFIIVNRLQSFLLMSYLLTVILSGAMFFFGTDLLMCIFILSTAATFLILAGSVTNSPYSTMGSSRELLQDMTCEPAMLLAAVGFYLARGIFNISTIATQNNSAVMYLPGFFFALLFILTIKMHKSPFDLSQSHHAHQELVKGISTEMGARNLAMFNITEWYETVFMLGMVALFIVNKHPISWVIAILVVLATYFVEILIDNSSARMKTRSMITLSWGVTILCAGVNLLVLMLNR